MARRESHPSQDWAARGVHIDERELIELLTLLVLSIRPSSEEQAPVTNVELSMSGSNRSEGSQVSPANSGPTCVRTHFFPTEMPIRKKNCMIWSKYWGIPPAAEKMGHGVHNKFEQ